jgi:hypothetical protein
MSETPNFHEMMKKLDEIEAGSVSDADVEELDAELQLSVCHARAAFIKDCKTLGYTDGEIQDGLVRYDQAVEDMSRQALDALRKKTRVLN